MVDDLYKKLCAPFADEDIEWRVGNTNQKSVARQTGDPKARPTKGMMLPYVQNRAIMNRLDETVGMDGWHPVFKELHKGIVCRLTLRIGENWISKEDGADPTNIEATKGGCSLAMKRAAVQFGIGRYLYDAETVWVDLDELGRPKTKPVLKLKKDDGKSRAKKQADDFINQL